MSLAIGKLRFRYAEIGDSFELVYLSGLQASFFIVKLNDILDIGNSSVLLNIDKLSDEYFCEIGQTSAVDFNWL